jgi:hypothetical protein
LRRALPIVVASALLLAAADRAAGQETPPRPRPDREVRDDRFDDRFADELPEDSLWARQADTLPRIDVEARRESLAGQEGFPDRDALFRELLALPGFYAIEYRGREARVDVDVESLRLTGDAQVNRASDVLVADSILYRGPVRFIEARRNIELIGGDGTQVTSDSVLYFDLSAQKGTVYRAETQFNQRGANWRVIGNVIPMSRDTLYAASSEFTSCDLDEPHYTFRAGRIKVVSQDVIVAWPVVLYVSNVPVFWLPFFASDIRPGRRSGILPPRFGVNDVVQTSGGATRNVTEMGYYWAISDYMDAQTTLDWFSGEYTRLNGRFNYRFLKKFIRGGAFYSQSFGNDGSNLRADFDHDQDLGLNTQLRASLQYIQDTRIYQDQSFRPDEQTQTIDSDLGLNHRFRFANLSLSGRRRQYLSGERTETTFPSVNLSFSPVNLFPAPRTRQGPFNNITLSGSGSFARRATTVDPGTDNTTVSGAARAGLTLRRLSLSGSMDFQDQDIVPEDSLGVDLASVGGSRLGWTTALDYQFDLMGSTTLRPTASLQGALARSDTLDLGIVSGPTRASFGATLSTDVYGFYPGFASFARVRHKVSPNLVWQYTPAATVDSVAAALFPGEIRERNTLTLRFNQTFEAKLKSADRTESRDTTAAGEGAPADTLAPVEGLEALPGDSVALGTGPVGGDRDPGEVFVDRGATTRSQADRAVTLLAIQTDALTFDFAQREPGGSSLITDKLGNRISSDLFRGFQLTMRHDLFEGTGSERSFKPFLESLVLSFSLRSGTGLGDLFGLGGGGTRDRPRDEEAEAPQRVDSRSRLREFEGAYRRDPFERREGGAPWSVSLRYSLLRSRPSEPGQESKTIDGTVTFNPTPKWSVRWTTQYNFTTAEFGAQYITLDRDLHRWRASFQFSRTPNGNTLFQVSVRLTDAPEIKGDYNQRTR